MIHKEEVITKTRLIKLADNKPIPDVVYDGSGPVFFNHIYVTLNVSVLVNGLIQQPKPRHACMEHGYWCPKQIREQGLSSLLAYWSVKVVTRYRKIKKWLDDSFKLNV